MLVTFIDESIPYDGHSPTSQPLGGGEKAVVGLAAALAGRGHTVRVFNGCEFPVVADGVSWQPLDECQAARSDWLIVHKDPRLLSRIADADRRGLLLSASAEALADDRLTALIQDLSPVLLFQGLAHSFTLPAALQASAAGTLRVGVGESFRSAAPMAPVNPPRAVVTTHPGRGLHWLLDLWCDTIHPSVPWAELHIYSAVLEKGALGAVIPERLRPVLAKAKAAAAQGVRLKRPLADPEMVDVYRQARAHLYPSSDRDMLCSTLVESQAVGVPSVARPLGAARERIRNTETGFLTADDETFADNAKRLLDDTETFERMSASARESHQDQSWDHAAEQTERALV